MTSSGLESERHADDDPLAHAAGELVRIRSGRAALDADQLEELAGPGERLALRPASRGRASCRGTDPRPA